MTNPLAYDESRQIFHCLGCMEIIEVSRRVIRDPERFVMMREMAEIDHKGCGEYDDARLARNARMFSKRVKLLLVKR